MSTDRLIIGVGAYTDDHEPESVMNTPRRIQRRRAAGWRMPPGARYVGRPEPWGNPYPANQPTPEARADAVARYRAWLGEHPDLVAQARRELAGHDLACWCPLDGPCHADVLLTIANHDQGASDEQTKPTRR